MGVITWTPTEGQAPSTNVFTTVVTDNGVPALSATNQFTVVVTEVNTAPVMVAVTDRVVNELSPLNLTLGATDNDLPANTLTFALVSGPAGLAVSGVGALSWTPAEAQGPSTNVVMVKVMDDGVPALSATNTFTVVVTEVNTAPVLAAQTNRTMVDLATLVVTNTATDADLPANALGYTLTGPSGSAISAMGVITWTPTEGQAPSTNVFTTVVTDSGSPTLSATNTFTVVVERVVPSGPVVEAGIREGVFSLRWNAVIGRRYQVQIKGDMGDAVWLDHGAVRVADSGHLELSEPMDAPGWRFYRVVQLP
jgi:hypothetical protein